MALEKRYKEQIKLRNISGNVSQNKIASQRRLIEVYLRLNRTVTIDCYKIDTITNTLAVELYAKLLDLFEIDVVKKLVEFQSCNSLVRISFETALNQYEKTRS